MQPTSSNQNGKNFLLACLAGCFFLFFSELASAAGDTADLVCNTNCDSQGPIDVELDDPGPIEIPFAESCPKWNLLAISAELTEPIRSVQIDFFQDLSHPQHLNLDFPPPARA